MQQARERENDFLARALQREKEKRGVNAAKGLSSKWVCDLVRIGGRRGGFGDGGVIGPIGGVALKLGQNPDTMAWRKTRAGIDKSTPKAIPTAQQADS